MDVNLLKRLHFRTAFLHKTAPIYSFYFFIDSEKIFAYLVIISKALPYGIFELVSTQNFPKKQHYLIAVAHTYMWVSKSKKN